jgi:hypothetical protein
MLSMWYSTSLTPDASFNYFAWVRVYQMIGLPFLFIPINTVAYDGLPQEKTNQGSALMNVARNLGGSIGISLANVELTQRTQLHQSRLVDSLADAARGAGERPGACRPLKAGSEQIGRRRRRGQADEKVHPARTFRRAVRWHRDGAQGEQKRCRRGTKAWETADASITRFRGQISAAHRHHSCLISLPLGLWGV